MSPSFQALQLKRTQNQKTYLLVQLLNIMNLVKLKNTECVKVKAYWDFNMLLYLNNVGPTAKKIKTSYNSTALHSTPCLIFSQV